MGFDLVAKTKKRGTAGYYGAGIEFMGFLRAAMLAAGVPEALVYRKFVANDNLFVTPLQATTIARKLGAWLKGRDLVLDLAETHEHADVSMRALQSVQQAVGNRTEAARLDRRRRAKRLPVRVDPAARKAIRQFAAFCERSGGFYVG